MSLKMKPEHYQYLKEKMQPLNRADVKIMKAKIFSDPKVKDPAMRFRWDLFRSTVPFLWVRENLYYYLTDNHIDSALKQIVKDLDLEVL